MKSSRTFRYPAGAVMPDALRGAAGLLLTASPLPWLVDTPLTFAIFGVLAAAFAVFSFSTLQRLRAAVRLDDAGISTSGIRGATVAWDRMQAVDLSYFSTRRDREKGWMQLRVRGDAGTIRLDSSLDGFSAVAGRTIDAARRRGLPLSETTLANLSALGAGGLERKPTPSLRRSELR